MIWRRSAVSVAGCHAIVITGQLHELPAQRFALGVAGQKEELGSAQVKTGHEVLPFFEDLLVQGRIFGLPVCKCRDGRRDRAHVFQHIHLTDPTEPPIYLEVQARVGVNGLAANRQARHAG